MILKTVRCGTSIVPRRDCGIAKSPRRSRASAVARMALLSWKRKNRARRLRRRYTILLLCSAKQTAASVAPQSAPCKSHRHCTRGTRRLPIRAPIRARYRRITFRQSDRHWQRSRIRSLEKCSITIGSSQTSASLTTRKYLITLQLFRPAPSRVRSTITSARSSTWLRSASWRCSFRRHNTRTPHALRAWKASRSRRKEKFSSRPDGSRFIGAKMPAKRRRKICRE